MWTVARDVISDLQRLGLMQAGILPRKQSVAHRYADTPCQSTDLGLNLAQLHKESPGRAFDRLLLLWANKHQYFRVLIARLRESPIFVPDVTSVTQVGASPVDSSKPAGVAERIAANCLNRLGTARFEERKRQVFTKTVHERMQHVCKTLALGELDAKRWVDNVQDKVVIPAFLAAEGLPFDAVTFQNLLKAAKDFLAASWTTAHPDHALRVIFSTCEFEPAITADPAGEVTEIIHHGRSYASERFRPSLVKAYERLAGSGSSYVNAYVVRAIVCVDLQIHPQVFAVCLKQLIDEGPASRLAIYTELPFDPPPQGEDYLQLDQNRIGLIKITSNTGA